MVQCGLEIRIAKESDLVPPHLDPAVIQHGLLRHEGALAMQERPKCPWFLGGRAAQQAAEKAHFWLKSFKNFVATELTPCYRLDGIGLSNARIGARVSVVRAGQTGRRQGLTIGGGK
jgi:hypothetical protein